MKGQVLAISVWILALLMSAPAEEGASRDEPVCGGWSSAVVTDPNVAAAATFALQAQEKALQKEAGARPVRLELVAIHEAGQQVVAGINYRLKLTVRVDGKEKAAEAIVWWQAWRKSDPYQLTSWTWP